LDRAADSDSAG